MSKAPVKVPGWVSLRLPLLASLRVPLRFRV